MFMTAALQFLPHLAFSVNISVRAMFGGQLSKFRQINLTSFIQAN